MKPMLSSAVLNGVAELTEQYGYCADSIASRAWVDPTALYRTDLVVSTRGFNNLLEEAAAVCDERFFGVKLAQMQGIGSLHPILQSTLEDNANVVSEVVNHLSRNIDLSSQQLSSHLVMNSGGITFCFEVRRVSTAGKVLHHSLVQATEHLMCHCCCILRQVLGSDWRPSQTQFRHADPGKRSALEKVFGTNLFFNQDVNAIRLSNEEYSQRLGAASKTDQLDVNRKSGNVEPGSPFLNEVNNSILRLINAGSCNLDKVADSLDIKRRTLQYRLRNNNTSYQALYDSARFELARQYLLQSDLSVVEIGERLNFADSPGFCHFFKNRTGCSPKEYIEKLDSLS